MARQGMSPLSQRAWRHGRLVGNARMMLMHSLAIMKADTVTEDAKRIAARINADALELAKHLAIRVD